MKEGIIFIKKTQTSERSALLKKLFFILYFLSRIVVSVIDRTERRKSVNKKIIVKYISYLVFFCFVN